MDNFWKDAAPEKESNYIDANSVQICTVTSVEYNEQYNRLNFVFTNDKEQTGKGSFSMSDSAMPFVRSFIISMAIKGGVEESLKTAVPDGALGTGQSLVDKVAPVLVGTKVAVLFGGKQSKGNWYAEAQLFGSLAEPTPEGVAVLEAKRLTKQNDPKFMKGEEVKGEEVKVADTPVEEIKF